MTSTISRGGPARPLKYLPLIWACLWRRPARTLLGMVSVTIAFTLYGLVMGGAVGVSHAAAAQKTDMGSGFLLGAAAVSAIGFTLILFLTANAMAQSVRLRMGEFGVLKAIGFSHRLILGIVAAEAILPCMAGAVLGLITAKLLFFGLTITLPALERFPTPVYTPPLLAIAAVIAIFMGIISAAIPAARITRLNVVDALREI